MYKYILFDLDGTLTDPKEGITECVRHALRCMEIEPPDNDELLDFIGPPLVDSFIKRFNMSMKEAEFAVTKYRERFSSVGMFENRVYEGIPDMLERLKKSGCILGVASLKPLIFVEKILEKFELSKYFVAICGSDLEGTKHKKEQIIRDALEILKPTRLSEVIMAGDRFQDVEGAKVCGIASIGVTYGYARESELDSADFIADTPKEICEIIF